MLLSLGWVLGLVHAANLDFVTPAALPWAVVDRTYKPAPLEVRSFGTCATGGLGYQVMSGDLPPGIALSAAGYLSGTPLRTGGYTFVVRVMNGCTWTQQPFTLVVARAPVLAPTPSKFVLEWPESGLPPVAVISIASSWPNQAYAVLVRGGEWLEARPQRGKTVSSSGSVYEDQVELRVRLNERALGRYVAMVEFTAWQMQPLLIPVEMEIGEPGVERHQANAPQDSKPEPIPTSTHPEVPAEE